MANHARILLLVGKEKEYNAYIFLVCVSNCIVRVQAQGRHRWRRQTICLPVPLPLVLSQQAGWYPIHRSEAIPWHQHDAVVAVLRAAATELVLIIVCLGTTRAGGAAA